MKPYLIYYLHYKDDRFMEPNFNKNKDYCACVMAENYDEAVRKTKIIAYNWGADHIKIMGAASGREEWVDEIRPLGVADKVMPLGGWIRGNKSN